MEPQEGTLNLRKEYSTDGTGTVYLDGDWPERFSMTTFMFDDTEIVSGIVRFKFANDTMTYEIIGVDPTGYRLILEKRW